MLGSSGDCPSAQCRALMGSRPARERKEKKMVLQMPLPQKGRMFVASSDKNQEKARYEVRGWAEGNGYGQPETAHTFTIFGLDASAREWVLLKQRRRN